MADDDDDEDDDDGDEDDDDEGKEEEAGLGESVKDARRSCSALRPRATSGKCGRVMVCSSKVMRATVK